ncbi:SusC/RagA family TonB-linked outer membrane protein [Pedobacter yulinensis]|uniref:SusC/RagA family TonB-linked outer membrane protein n=1 Tax=Pedobacter yulinensis TaxID=2126353 RepID=A0A2T3HIT6_9SPHI|nr:SusC/RagA family TonB-linked outer membrane protein [Pedobacter yulinensis]PST82356.1 SusC/RagA family TonB-linked outer membrane protein [Pedobacter yulinensis]
MKVNLLKISGLCSLLVFSSPLYADASGATWGHWLTWKPSGIQVQKVVTGTVTDEADAPLPGVSIRNTVTGKTTVTDANGKYRIEAGNDDTLVFTYIGYTTISEKPGGRSVISFGMQPSSDNKLDEVVVVGYGTQNIKEVTSAITKIDTSQFRQSGARSAMDLLIGKVAGLQLTRTSGTNPNSGVAIQLRGVTSVSVASSPLIVIDGIPGGNLDLLQQDDIESFSVLKDGSAAAIYGTRANAGVILITTKKGKAGPSRFDYNAYVRHEVLNERPDFMNAAEFREKIASKQYSAMDYGGDFDYFYDLINKNNISNNHNFAVSGGGANSNYRVSLNYRDLQGFAKQNDRREYSARLSLTQKGFQDRVTAQFNVATNYNNPNLIAGGGWETVLVKNPTESYYKPDGSFAFTRNITNEIARLEQEKYLRSQQTSSVDGKIDVDIISGLRASVFGAVQRDSYVNNIYRMRGSQNSIENGESPGGGYAEKGSVLNQNFSVEPTLDYNKSFGQHKIQALAGYSYRYEVGENFGAWNRGYLNDVFEENNLGSVPIKLNTIGISSGKSDNTLIAFLSRVHYGFADKYFVQATFRREGSSKFGANNRWANFVSFSGAWNITEENFMKNVQWVNNLKLRGGYGETGNSGFANTASMVTLGGGGVYRFPGDEYQQTYGPSRNPNPNLRWEKKQETNIGIDFAVLKNRLSGSIELYNRVTKDLLDTYTSPQPPFIQSSIYTNVGTISAKGIELTLNYQVVNTSKFRYSIDFIGSTTDNRLDAYSNDEYKRDMKTFGGIGGFGALGDAIRTYEGGKLGEFWGKRFAGFTPDGKWTFFNKDGNVVSNAQINTSVFRDQTDLAVIGNAIPKYYLSLTNNFTYANFDLRVFLRSKLDYDILNTLALSYGNKNGTQGNLLRTAFTKYNEIKDTYMYSDYYIESGSFVKLDEVTLGYTFKIPNKTIRNLRVYATGSNLATFTKYTGNDPDTVQDTGLGPGIDSRSPYPWTRQFLFGVNFGF